MSKEDKETKYIMETDVPGKIQQKLNTWKAKYDIEIILVSAPTIVEGQIINTVLIKRSPKSN